MGEVFRARDRKLNREVATKVLPPSSPRKLASKYYPAILWKEIPVESRSLPALKSRSIVSLILSAAGPGTLRVPQWEQSSALTFSTSA